MKQDCWSSIGLIHLNSFWIFKVKLSVSSYVSRPQKYTLRGSFKKIRKVTGFRALYFHYCYLLGIFPKKRPLKKRSVPILFREDLIRAKTESEIDEITSQRKQLYKVLRSKNTVQDGEIKMEVKEKISAFNAELKKLRYQVKLCKDIIVRSEQIKEKFKTIREDAENQRKEREKDEQFRGRG